MFGPSKESNLQHHRCLHNELPHKEWLDPSIRTFFPYLAQKSLLKCAYMFCIVLAKLIDLLFSCRTQLAILHHNENVKWEQVADIEWKLRFAWKHLTAKKHWVYSSKHIYLVGLCLKTNFRIICLCHILRHSRFVFRCSFTCRISCIVCILCEDYITLKNTICFLVWNCIPWSLCGFSW